MKITYITVEIIRISIIITHGVGCAKYFNIKIFDVLNNSR